MRSADVIQFKCVKGRSRPKVSAVNSPPNRLLAPTRFAEKRTGILLACLAGVTVQPSRARHVCRETRSRSGVFPWTLAGGLWKARSRAGRPTQAAGGGTRPLRTPRRPRGPSGLWLRLREEVGTLLPGTFFWTLGAELPTSCARPLACVARGGRWRGQRTAPGSRASEPDRSGHLRASRCDQRAMGACRPPPARPAPPWSPGLQAKTRAPATPLACTGHTAQRSLLVPLFHPRAFSKGGGRSEGGFTC